MPPDWLTTLGLIAATLASVAACIAALRRTLGKAEHGKLQRIERGGVLTVVVLCGAVFVYRAVLVHQGWEPLSSHVDGLTLLAALLAAVVAYLQWADRLRGVDVFALPVLTVITLWGVCASWWTLREFEISTVWFRIHLWAIYLSTLSIATAAAAGALYLYVDRQMRSKDHRRERLKRLGRLGNLESIESGIVVAASAGFVLLTIALPTGGVVLSDEGQLHTGWWYTPKVLLAVAVWLIFAVVMHVRYVPTFRGRRAAVLSIIGFVLLMTSMGFALGSTADEQSTPQIVQPSPPETHPTSRDREGAVMRRADARLSGGSA
ncbi:MAG: cytochrome c biogenesis protein CcsA [Phycisphaeraceae bacterium]